MYMKKATVIFFSGLACFGLAQFVRPDMDSVTGKDQPADKQLLSSLPDSVQSIFRQSCYDCHSRQANLRWFDKVTPVNFWVVSHIKEARQALDLSKFDSLNTPQQNSALYYALNKVLSGEMPLPAYTFAHADAKMTDKDITTLKAYLTSRTPRKQADSAQVAATLQTYQTKLPHAGLADKVAPASNSIAYISGYRGWKAISTTDRFDNGSMRIIYGNDVAIEAIRTGHTNPWPDGTVFAKTAWWQQFEKDGIVRQGQFIQVEFMIKDAKKYAATEGWGWARWRGNDLTPYGKDAQFTQECVTCHRPMKDNDYVFTEPVYASLTLPENPLLESVIVSSIDPGNGKMATLYGNKVAWDYANGHSDTQYPQGAILYQVTWKQRPDPVWFGGNTPKEMASVERIVFTGNAQPEYALYEGTPLRKAATGYNTERVGFISSQRMAVSP